MIFILCLFPCFLWFLFVIRTTWSRKLFIFCFSLTCALSLTSLCNIIATWYYRNGSEGDLPYGGISLPVILLFTALILPPLFVLLKKGYMPIYESMSKKESNYLAILSLLLFLVLASNLMFAEYRDLLNSVSIFLYIALMATVFIIYTILFRMLSLTHEKFMAEKKSTALSYQLEIRDEQYRRINEGIEHSRRMRHDLRHHLITVRGFISSGNLKEAERYLDSRIKLSEKYEPVKLCDVPVINWIVSYYQALAKENDTEFDVHIKIPNSEWTVSDADLSVLLGNLLENALSAALLVSKEERKISLGILCSGKMLAITVDNTFDGHLNISGSRYLSTKEGHHAIGMKSIEQIAEKYSGGVEFAPIDNVFRASVMLNIGQIN